MSKLNRFITISFGVLGLLFILLALFIGISMKKNSDIHITYSNGFDTSYVVDISTITGNINMISNHLDTQRNGIVTKTKMGTLSFVKKVLVFCDYYYFKKDLGELCRELEEYIMEVK